MTSPSADQTINSSMNRPMGSGTRNPWATGLTLFAGVRLAIVGVFQFFQGLAAIVKGGFYVIAPNNIDEFSTSGWGRIHLILGIVLAVTGLFILTGQVWAGAAHPRTARSREALQLWAHGRTGSPIVTGGTHLRRGSGFTGGDNEKSWVERGFGARGPAGRHAAGFTGERVPSPGGPCPSAHCLMVRSIFRSMIRWTGSSRRSVGVSQWGRRSPRTRMRSRHP